MSRLEKHNKKAARNRIIATFVLIGVIIVFFLNSGIALLIDGSVAVARLLGGNRAQQKAQEAPDFGIVEIDEVPSATNSAAVIVSGRAHNMAHVFPYLNGVKLDEIEPDDSGTFSVEVEPLESGDNDIYISGESKSGGDKKKSDTFTVTYSAEKPSVEISEPSDGLKTPRTEVTVAGTVKSTTGSVLRVNGSPAVIGQGGSFRTFVKLNEGENTITVAVTDDAGNTEEKSVKVTYEK